MSLVSRKFKINQLVKKQQLIFRLLSTTSQVSDTQIDNNKAIKLINYLYVNNKKKAKDSYKTIEQALDIYDKITESPTHETIDNLLRLFFNFGHPEQYVSIWDDIEHIQSNGNNENELISYPMLIKCCIESPHIDTTDCIQILSWMKESNFTLKINDSYIAKLIKHCVKQKDVESLDYIYSLFNDGFLENTPNFIKTTFISAYSKCNELQKSEDIFNGINEDELKMISIGTMMKSYIGHHRYSDALTLYDGINNIKNPDLHQNDHCDSMALQACIKSNNFSKGAIIHDNVNKKLYKKGKSELEMNDHVKHALISLYGHFGDLKQSELLFNSMRNTHCNAIVLNGMMTVYIKNNRNESALELYQRALDKNATSNILAIKACINTKNYILGQRFYSDMVIRPFDFNLKNILIDFFGQCSDIKRAKNIFHSMNEQKVDNVSIGAMMEAFIENNHNKEALELYHDAMSNKQNRYIGVGSVNNVCTLMAIKACINAKDYDKGHEIINRLDGKLDDDKSEDIQLSNVIIDFYGNSGDIDKAKEIFHGIDDSKKTIFSVGVMMKTLINNGLNEDALKLYDDGINGLKHDTVTHKLAIKAAGNLCDIDKGMEIHERIKNVLCDNIELQNALIEFYGNCMDIDKALELFNNIDDKDKNIKSIGSMMDGLRKNGLFKECLDLFGDIGPKNKYKQLKPNLFCYIIALKACNHENVGIDVGRNIHKLLMRNVDGNEWILKDVSIRCALIGMYGVHGMLDECLKVFGDPALERNVIIWNVLLSVYAKNGELDECQELYDLMCNEYNIKVDSDTFIGLLTASLNAGNVAYSKNVWEKEINDMDTQYDLNVVTVYVECLAQNGYIKDAHDVIQKYEDFTNDKQRSHKMWESLLSAMTTHNNTELDAKYVEIEYKQRLHCLN